jgi:signal-transduction protein with cAMP-binding, CBS, and nucleotidyltransferase domain
MSATGPQDTATVTRAGATVEQLMRPPATTVEPSAHLAAAAYLMKRSCGGALIVTTDDDRHRPVAILTDADVTQAVADGRNLEETRINQVVSGDPLTVEVDTGVREAAELMLSRAIHHLPVVRDGHLVGVLGISDVCRALL